MEKLFALINLTNKIFGRLRIICRTSNNKWGSPRWLCKCSCGNETITEGSSLKNGSTKSCGCLKKEGNNYKHGNNTTNKRTQIYRAWAAMLNRCNNTKYERYHQWGKRGIKVCNRWYKFENFLEDMGNPPTKYHSLDRINNDGNYCKSNCRWATPKEQGRNKRNNRLISFNDKTQCLSAWAEEYKIKSSIIADRLKHNWPIKKALITPPKKWKI